MLWTNLITFTRKDLPAKKFTTVWKDLTSTKYFGILSIFTHFSAPTLNLPTWNFPSCTIHHTPLVWGTESTATNGKLQLTWTCLAPLAKPRIIARKLARIIVKGERSLFTEKAVHLSVFSIITQARGGKKSRPLAMPKYFLVFSFLKWRTLLCCYEEKCTKDIKLANTTL